MINLLSSKIFFPVKKKLNFEKILNENQDKDLLLWENKEVSKTVINKLPKSVNIKLFKIPTVIFKFLDSLFPGNERSSLLLLRECLNYSDPEMVFFMIIRQIRNLIIVKDLGNNSSSITSWQSSRLTNQAKSFTIDKLIAMYKKLLEMDISIKTGTSSYSLQKQIELFILSLKDV